MTYGHLLERVKKLQQPFTDYATVVKELEPLQQKGYPVDSSRYEGPQRTMQALWAPLDKYLQHFSTGWSYYRGAIVGEGRGPEVRLSRSAIRELEGVIAVLSEEPPEKEVVLPQPDAPPARAGSAGHTYGAVTITGGNVSFGDGTTMNITSVTLGDLFRRIESEVEAKVSDPKEKRSILDRLKDLTKNPAFAIILQTALPEILKHIPGSS